jgi:ribosomal RNA-processing protein 12
MHTEILSTLLVFLTSSNREIVKSTLGYIKLAIHTLSTSLLKPHLKELVPALLRWSHDHKNHFKSKVRHIFERMLRRFGWEDVWACAGEEEAAKVLLNIKKRKERAKRRRARADDEDDEDVSDIQTKFSSRTPHLHSLGCTSCCETGCRGRIRRCAIRQRERGR